MRVAPVPSRPTPVRVPLCTRRLAKHPGESAGSPLLRREVTASKKDSEGHPAGESDLGFGCVRGELASRVHGRVLSGRGQGLLMEGTGPGAAWPSSALWFGRRSSGRGSAGPGVDRVLGSGSDASWPWSLGEADDRSVICERVTNRLQQGSVTWWPRFSQLFDETPSPL